MKRRILLGLLAAASLCLPAKAARPVAVQVDGEALASGAYVEKGATHVPLRDLLNALGDWDVWWDSRTGTAQAATKGSTLTADPGCNTLTINGLCYSCAVNVIKGRTYVPLRLTAETLGSSVKWDPWLDGAAVTSAGADYDAMDYYWLSHIIHAESGGEPLEGQIAVGNVVLNRVASQDFPDSIPEVIFDLDNGVQFEPTANGTVTGEPTELSREAARRALDGENTAGDALYFYAPALSEGTWIEANRSFEQTIGCHRFYR